MVTANPIAVKYALYTKKYVLVHERQQMCMDSCQVCQGKVLLSTSGSWSPDPCSRQNLSEQFLLGDNTKRLIKYTIRLYLLLQLQQAQTSTAIIIDICTTRKNILRLFLAPWIARKLAEILHHHLRELTQTCQTPNSPITNFSRTKVLA